jgi:FMN phosphatase YigB (HAD superfamily)
MPNEIVVIGDVLDADIAMARRFGSPSIYVGRSHGRDKSSTGVRPDFVAQSLEDAVQLLVVGSR